MIVFITSLRHPRNSNDYENVLRLMRNTLASVCAQQDQDFHVIVVCNRIPPPEYHHSKVTFLRVGFPPPSEANHACIGMEALRLDRGCKYLVALLKARDWNPDHVMFFDADDYVSSHIASHANSNPANGGWIFRQGYVYDQELNLFGRLNNFHMVCGTSHIVPYSAYTFPPGLDEESSQDDILNAADHHYLFKVIGSHRWLSGYLADRGTNLADLPFDGALYFIGNGENHTSRVISCALWSGMADDMETVIDEPETLDVSEIDRIREEFSFRLLPGQT